MEDIDPYLPERSKFYNLEPIGAGTTEAESFSGYISRLAQEHLVTPVILIKNSVNQLEQLPQVLSQNSIPATFAANLNGFGETSEKSVELFRKATFREDIQATTLSAWKGKISSHGLLKKHLAWCSICFQEQLITNELVYEKLIWTFETIKVCLLHRTELSEVCPYCQSKLKVLSGKSRPGFCSKCLRWLGLKTISKTIREESKEFWIAKNAGKFLLINSQVKNSFSINLHNLIQQTTNGNINDFAHLTGVWHLAIRRLLKGEILPTLEMLIDICYPLKISIIDLFTENTKFGATKNNNQFTADKTLTKEEIKSKLAEYCNENPPPSANKVARRIGWRTTRFQRNFPIEYEKIVERYLQYQADKLPNYTDKQIEEILINTINETPPPSLQSVFRRIGCRSTGYRYYSRFPELCEKISNRYKQANKIEFDLEKAKQVLKSALKEKPPPSFSEVARRLKCSRTTLYKKFPKLSVKLHEKYESSLKIIRDKNKQEMYDEIALIIDELQAGQKSVTENAVRKLLKRKWNDKNFKKAYQEIRLKSSN
jgi:transcriptional regulator with XRE-family HTH domain/predicted DNA-binding protein YlxM (UPF0122 family)